jgi:hypothetical protein
MQCFKETLVVLVLKHHKYHINTLLITCSQKLVHRHDIAEILLKVALKHQKSINQTKLDLPRSENVDI